MLAKEIVLTDAQQFKNQNPEYAANPSDEIKRSMVLLRSKPLWRDRYQDFIQNMVFDLDSPFDYDKAINLLEQISMKIIEILN